MNGETYAVGTVLDRQAALADSDPVTEPADVQPPAPRLGEGEWASPNG